MAEDMNSNVNEEQNNGMAPEAGTGTAQYNLADVVASLGVEAILADPTINAEVLSRRDRHTTQALNTARQKWDADAQKKANAAADEATRLAAMSETEKERYQLDRDREAFEEQKKAFEHKNLVLETSKQMIGAGLPDLADYVTGRDAEETAANITKVTEILGVWKSEQMNAAMRGKTPKEMNVNQPITKESIKNMSRDEINKAYEEGRLKNIQ